MICNSWNYFFLQTQEGIHICSFLFNSIIEKSPMMEPRESFNPAVCRRKKLSCGNLNYVLSNVVWIHRRMRSKIDLAIRGIRIQHFNNRFSAKPRDFFDRNTRMVMTFWSFLEGGITQAASRRSASELMLLEAETRKQTDMKLAVRIRKSLVPWNASSLTKWAFYAKQNFFPLGLILWLIDTDLFFNLKLRLLY